MPAENAEFVPPQTPRQWLPDRQVEVMHLALDVRIDIEAQTVSGWVSHRLRRLPQGRQDAWLLIHEHGLQIESVEVDGTKATWHQVPDGLHVSMPSGPEAFTVRLAFHCERPLKGMHFRQADGDGARAMAFSQGCMQEHHWWFPCIDDPRSRATQTVRMTHRDNLIAVSNGICDGAEHRGDGWTVTTFHLDQAQPLYLLSVAVGDFETVVEEGGTVPVTHYLPRGSGPAASATFRSCRFAMRWFSTAFDRAFPWPGYGHLAVRDFLWGGMENSSLTTIGERSLIDRAVINKEGVDSDRLIIHELAHQWFGDLLTTESWTDIWLNEGFATYWEGRAYAAWAAECGRGDEDALLALERWDQRQGWFAQEAQDYSRPVVTDRWLDAYDLFDRVAYEKGAQVLHALASYLGDERFLAVIRRYVADHAGRSVATSDFRRVVSDLSGEALDWFFSQWLDRAGYPRVRMHWQFDARRQRLVVDLTQTQAGEVYILPMTCSFSIGGRIHTRQVILRDQHEVLSIGAMQAPDWLVLDADGDVPVAWDERVGSAELRHRVTDGNMPVFARARSAKALGSQAADHLSVQALISLVAEEAQPRLLRRECIRALGACRTAAARDGLLAAYKEVDDPALRRSVADALAGFTGDADLAGRLLELSAAEESELCQGQLLQARGTLRVAGAVPLLRARLPGGGWQDRQRQALLRGLGSCAEAAAFAELRPYLLGTSFGQDTRGVAAKAMAELASHLPHLQEACRLLLLQVLCDAPFRLRAALVAALQQLGDPKAIGALQKLAGAEVYGNISRQIRVAIAHLETVAAETRSLAAVRRELKECKDKLKQTEARLKVLEARLDE